MKWPLVWRSTLEATELKGKVYADSFRVERDKAETGAIRWANECERMSQRYDALIEKYHALKLQGAGVPEPRGLPVAERPRKAADQAIDTMVEKFGGSPLLRRRLQTFVHSERLRIDADEDAIAARVLNWSDPDEDDGN